MFYYMIYVINYLLTIYIFVFTFIYYNLKIKISTIFYKFCLRHTPFNLEQSLTKD